MNEILLLNIKFFVAFSFCYLITRITIKYFLKKESHNTKYILMKLIPLITIFVIGIDYYVKRVAVSARSINAAAMGEIVNETDIMLRNNSVRLFLAYFFRAALLVWIIGGVILSIKYVIEYFCFTKRYGSSETITSSVLNEKLAKCNKQLGVKEHVTIFYSKKAETPFTFGIVRPQIIIPIDVSENLEPIILHERIHCIRFDMFVKTAIEFLKIFQWLNPVIYIYAIDLADFCEIACDEKVSKMITFEERKKYACEIINSARIHKSPAYLTTFSSTENHKKRLYHLLYPTYIETKKSRALVILCVMIALVSGVSLIRTVDNSPIFQVFSKVLTGQEETLTKTIKVNYVYGQEAEDFYYEEYIDNFWWRGTLPAEESKPISDKLIEVTFSGELYKCEE